MSSKTKNFRRRADDSDNDDDNPNGSVPPSTSTTKLKSTPKSATTTKNKPKKPTTLPNQAPKKLLSFAEDDDEENSNDFPMNSIALAKSKLSSSSSRLNNKNNKTSLPPSSHKHSSSKDRLPPPPPSNVLPQSGQYGDEAINELRKNTKTIGSSSSSSHRPPPSEPVILLKGLVKPISESIKEEDELDHEEREEATTAHLASIGLGGKSIPDQAMINAIRARRERMRKSSAAAPDFIALDGGSNHGEAEGLSDEEPEFRGRIGFFGEKKIGVFDIDNGVGEKVAMEEIGFRKEVDEEEEEEKIWEEEQVRKGLGKRMDESSASARVVVTTSSSSVTLPVVVQSIPQQMYAYTPAVASYSTVPSIGGAIGGLPGLEVMSIPQQAEVAKKALDENFRRLKVCICNLLW